MTSYCNTKVDCYRIFPFAWIYRKRRAASSAGMLPAPLIAWKMDFLFV